MSLNDVWFFLWGLLWAIYFATDGFDLGVGVLLPFFSRSEEEKRILYNSIGPLWNGNEVWLITAGGVTFAAFPKVYATMFSALYAPLMLLLFALIVRGVAIDLREKSGSEKGKRSLDLVMFFASFIASILLGVAFGNICQGLPVDRDGRYLGSFFALLNPYGIVSGILFVSLFLTHGLTWIAVRTSAEVRERAKRTHGKLFWILVLILFTFLMLSFRYTDLFTNFEQNPVLILIPALGLLFLFCSRVLIRRDSFFKSWLSSFLAIIFLTLFLMAGLYPRLLPSSIDPSFSLTAYNASSSTLTLKIMLAVAAIFVPMVLVYQAWAYNIFRKPVEKDDLLY